MGSSPGPSRCARAGSCGGPAEALAALVVAMALAAASPLSAAENRAATARHLREVSVTPGAGGPIIHLHADGAIGRYQSFVLGGPERLVLDLPGLSSGLGAGPIDLGTEQVSRIRIGEHGGTLRVVFDAGTRDPRFRSARLLPTPDGLLVALGEPSAADASVPAARTEQAREDGPASRQVAAQNVPSAPTTADTAGGREPAKTASSPERSARATALLGITAERRGAGTLIHLRADGPIERIEDFALHDPERLVLDLPGLSSRVQKDELAVGTPQIQRVRIGQHAGRVRLVLEAAAGRSGVDATFVPVEDGVLVAVGDVPRYEIASARRGIAETDAVLAPPPVSVPPQAPRAPAPVPQAPTPAAVPSIVEEAEELSSDIEVASAMSVEELQPLREDGLSYRVSEFSLQYAREHPDQPSVEELRAIEIELGRLPSGYVAPREGVPTERITLGDVSGAPSQQFYGSAIHTVNEQIVAEFTRRGLASVLVIPHEEDIDWSASRDLRPAGRTDLRLVIWTGQLLEFRTFASGERIPEETRIDNPAHARLKERSPVQPGGLMRKRELDRYVARLNRHPGRRVDTSLSAASEPGGAYLDFLVAENRPLTLYAQASNTGTEETTDWRERFGLTHTQLTGRDDILRLDYVTGNFEEVNAVFGSYELPFTDRLRWRMGSSWTDYDASQFGFVESRFSGTQWDVSTALVANFWQREDLFLDGFAGLRYQQVEADNVPIEGDDTTRTRGSSNFLLPEVGLQLERVRDTSSLRAALSYEWNLDSIAETDSDELEDLGRNGVDEADFEILQWDLLASSYLEPWLEQWFSDASRVPEDTVLAHEFLLGARGQYAFGNRLIPQDERIAGGFYTVRGYPQSAVAGDTVYLGSAEYRFHLPRLLPVQAVPKQVPGVGEFRVAPQQLYGRPDWDLILRAFFDAGHTTNNESLVGEIVDETLLGAGLGIELQLRNNLSLRFDWGRALREARGGEINAGSSEYHFMMTLAR